MKTLSVCDGIIHVMLPLILSIVSNMNDSLTVQKGLY